MTRVAYGLRSSIKDYRRDKAGQGGSANRSASSWAWR